MNQLHPVNGALRPGGIRRVSHARRISTAAVMLLLAVGGALLIGLVRNEDPPQLFYTSLSGDQLDSYQGILAIGHNSGNQIGASEIAQRFGADVIEIDLRMINGDIRAAHGAPKGILGAYASRSPSLASAWDSASGAEAVSLDLKDSSPGFLRKLISFLKEHEDPETRVIITSRSQPALERLAADYPAAVRILSVPTRYALERVIEDPAALAVIDGISAQLKVFDDETVAWLNAHSLLSFAWVVNDLATLNRAVEWGVDAVTTDNLAMIEFLTSDRDEEAPVALVLDKLNEERAVRSGLPESGVR